MTRRLAFALIVGLVVFTFGSGVVVAQQAGEEAAELDAAAAFEVSAPAAVTVWQAMTPLATPDRQNTVFFSDFEGSDGGGTGTVDWEWGTYAWSGAGCGYTPAPPPGAYSGTDMWATVLNDCYTNVGNNDGYATCVNTNTADDSILSFTVDLSSVSQAWLYWWDWPDINFAFDWGEVYVNGVVVFQHCEGSYNPPTQWQQQEVDISAHAGGMATIEFHFMASTVVERGGWWVDDLLILDAQIPVELQSLGIE